MRPHIITFIVFLFLNVSFVACLSGQELIPAQPRGGERLVKEFIDEEMVYPEIALNNKIEGTVGFRFKVQEQGLVKDLEIIHPTDPLLTAEAKRIFRLLIWQPAQYRGKAVESNNTFEIEFSIKHYRKACRARGYEKIILPALPIDSSGTVYLYKYTDAQPEPVFASKNMDMQVFMAENFNYPEEALRRNITGVVKLNFIVEPHGHISNLMVVDNVGAGCTEEAIRLVRLLRWKPGMVNGKAVRVNMSIPVTFGLSSDGGYKVTPAAGGTTFQ